MVRIEAAATATTAAANKRGATNDKASCGSWLGRLTTSTTAATAPIPSWKKKLLILSFLVAWIINNFHIENYGGIRLSLSGDIQTKNATTVVANAVVAGNLAGYAEFNSGLLNSSNFNKPEKPKARTVRIRFTQMWSTGHVGTRFLTGLLAAPGYFGPQRGTSGGATTATAVTNPDHYMVWNEYQLPPMEDKRFKTPKMNKTKIFPRRPKSPKELSLQEFKSMMLSDNIRENADGQRLFQLFVGRKNNWYGGVMIKLWNTEGTTIKLERYLKKNRMPALWAVVGRYRNNNGALILNHLIKVGHTSVFFDLGDYYDVMSNSRASWMEDAPAAPANANHHRDDGAALPTVAARAQRKVTAIIDVDFVRIRRNRLDVAMSFLSDRNRKGPVHYGRLEHGIVTNPTMSTALLRLDSLGGSLPENTWKKWTVFQQHLWFVDEIEARWRVFRAERPEVRCYELNYTDVEEEEDTSEDDLDNDGSSSESNHHTTAINNSTAFWHRPRQELKESTLDDLAVNFLQLGEPVSPYMNRTPRQSHIRKEEVEDPPHGLTLEEQTKQAIGYSRQAPWCLQYAGRPNEAAKTLPKIDCGIN